MAPKKSAQPKAVQVTKLQAIRNALNAKFFERTEVIDGLLVALLAKEHLFMLGNPGTAKSDIARGLCEALGGAKFYERLLGKTTNPEELYGPYRLTALAKDQYVRNTEDTLLDCAVAFVDEVFKASSAINNSMLGVLNERIFRNGGQMLKLPLQTAVMASNELPQGEELGALWDRLALRFVVRRIQDDVNFETMLRARMEGKSAQIPTISIDELEADQNAAMALKVPAETMTLLLTIRRECEAASLTVSDRKWVQISRLIRAQAFLRGHDKVESEDLDVLQHVIWHRPEEMSQARKLVMKHCNPIGETLVDIRDAVTQISSEITKDHSEKDMTSMGVEFHGKIKRHLKKLNDLVKEHPNNSSLKDLVIYVQQVGKSVQTKFLDLE